MPLRRRARANSARPAPASAAKWRTARPGSEPPRSTRTSAAHDAPRARHGERRGDGDANAGTTAVAALPRRRGLDPPARAGECRVPRRVHAVTLLSPLSPDADRPPLPADPHLLALGRAAWTAALDEAAGDPRADAARRWSATPDGRQLQAAIFGNSPFLTSLAVSEWNFLTALIEQDVDSLFEATASAIETHADSGENRATLMRRLRVAKRRIALLAAVAELTGHWTLERQMTALSRFAEAAIGAAVRHLLREAAAAGKVGPLGDGNPEA